MGLCGNFTKRFSMWVTYRTQMKFAERSFTSDSMVACSFSLNFSSFSKDCSLFSRNYYRFLSFPTSCVKNSSWAETKFTKKNFRTLGVTFFRWQKLNGASSSNENSHWIKFLHFGQQDQSLLLRSLPSEC